jgi:hypothetical protein
MGGVRTSIFKRPRPLPGHRRAAHLYTLICEEPANTPSSAKSRQSRHRSPSVVSGNSGVRACCRRPAAIFM